MKKILLIMVFLVSQIPLLVAQQAQRSKLSVRFKDNTPLTISIDGRFFQKQDRVVRVGNLPSGRHRIKIYSVAPQRRARTILIYDGYLRITGGNSYYVVADRQNRTVRVNTGVMNNPVYHDDGDRTVTDRNTDRDHDGQRDDEGYNDYNNDRNDDGRDRDNDGYNNGRQLSATDLTDLQHRVAERITDTDKLKLLKSVLADRSYSTEQTRTMLRWLNFDSSKLEFAKWAYDNATDKRNFWKLEDEFSFSSSKDEFNEHITSKR